MELCRCQQQTTFQIKEIAHVGGLDNGRWALRGLLDAAPVNTLET